LNQVFRLWSNFGARTRETFGHFTTCEGGEVGTEGYG
jgi:hypothetical protein